MSDKPISPLRQRMIDDMTARRVKEKVQKDYVRHVRTFARHASLTDRNYEDFCRPGNRVGLLGLNGGPGRTRTCNQTVMSGRL